MPQAAVREAYMRATVQLTQSSKNLNASHLILGCRDVAKGEAAKQRLGLGKESVTKVQVWKVDMADFESVKAFSNRVNNELPRLDALIANAGMSTNEWHVAEKFEQTLTVNVISTLMLSLLCLRKLEQTAAATGFPSHLTIVGSLVHVFADHEQIVKPEKGEVFRMLSDKAQADMAGRYFLSKLILLLCVQKMAAHISRLQGSKETSVILNCPCPGWW